MIGDPATDFICIPDSQFADDNLCPTGTHEVAQADGNYQCVAPSGVACAGSSDLDSCSFTWGSNTINGTCYQGACLEDCSIQGNDCANGNSVCQATGVIGDPSTILFCVPSKRSPQTTPVQVEPMKFFKLMALTSAWHQVVWLAPARLTSQRVLTWGSNSISGTCYQGACLEDCTIAGNDCANSNSVCQATGVVGATGTDYVCIPGNTFTADNTCQAEPMKWSKHGSYQCVSPSGAPCVGQPDLAACSFTWGSNSVSGTCYQGACLEDCTIAGNDCANANSICQATGVVGLPDTDFVCIPGSTFYRQQLSYWHP